MLTKVPIFLQIILQKTLACVLVLDFAIRAVPLHLPLFLSLFSSLPCTKQSPLITHKR